MTTKTKLDANPWLVHMLDERIPDADSVRLSPGTGATEDSPAMHVTYVYPTPVEYIEVNIAS